MNSETVRKERASKDFENTILNALDTPDDQNLDSACLNQKKFLFHGFIVKWLCLATKWKIQNNLMINTTRLFRLKKMKEKILMMIQVNWSASLF